MHSLLTDIRAQRPLVLDPVMVSTSGHALLHIFSLTTDQRL